MLGGNPRYVDEHRYSRDELTLSLQRNPKAAEDATVIVVSALRTIKNSTVFWQYAIRRLRTACVVVQRMVRRLVIGAKLSVQQVVERWVKVDLDTLQRLESTESTEGFGPDSPFLFFNLETRHSVVRAMFVQQRFVFRQKFRRWLHELRNLELEMEMLKDDLALQKRRMAPTFASAGASQVLADGLRRQRKSLFAGSLGVGPNASQIIASSMYSVLEGSRSNSLAVVSPLSGPITPSPRQRSASMAGSSSSPQVTNTITSAKAAASAKKAAAKATLTLRTIEDRITTIYNTMYRHKLHAPRFEFAVDFKALHASAMELYADDAKQKVSSTMAGLGVASRNLLTTAIAERIRISHAAVAASAPALVAQRAFSSSGEVGHAASFTLNRLGSQRTGAVRHSVVSAATDAMAEKVRAARQGSRSDAPINVSAMTSTPKRPLTGSGPRAARASTASSLSHVAVSLQKAFSKHIGLSSPRSSHTPKSVDDASQAVPSVSAPLEANNEPATEFVEIPQLRKQSQPTTNLPHTIPRPPDNTVGHGPLRIRLASTLEQFDVSSGSVNPNTFLTETDTMFEVALPSSVAELDKRGYSYLSKLGMGDICHLQPKSNVTTDDIESAFDAEMEILKRQGVVGGSSQRPKWAAHNNCRPQTAHVSQLPCNLRTAFNSHVTSVPTRTVSPRSFQSQFIPPTHTLTSIVDEELLMRIEHEESMRKQQEEARLTDNAGLGPLANKAAAIRAQSAKARLAQAAQREEREQSADYVTAQDPKAKFRVPPRDKRMTSSELDQLRGVYPFHRFYNVNHEDQLSTTSTPVSVLFGKSVPNATENDGVSQTVSAPKLVTIDDSTGRVTIQKHLLKHSYPLEYATHQATRLQAELAKQKEEAALLYHTPKNRRLRLAQGPSPVQPAKAPAQVSSKVYLPPALTPAFMDKLMGEHEFTAATQLVVRSMAEDWQRTGVLVPTIQLSKPQAAESREANPFQVMDSQSPIAPFRRAPSSNALREPISLVASIRNHSCGITAVMVIDSVSDEATGSKQMVATGAFDGVVRIVTFPDLKEWCHNHGKGMVTEMKATRDKGTLCVAYDEGFVCLFKRKRPKIWASNWEVHATFVISKPALHPLSMALYGDQYLVVGCHAGRMYVVPTELTTSEQRGWNDKKSGLTSPTDRRKSVTPGAHRLPTSPPLGPADDKGLSLSHQPRPPTRTSSMEGLLSPTSDAGSLSLAATTRTRPRRGSTAVAFGTGIKAPIEHYSIVQLETNVLGVNKVLSYSTEMIVTGGLDAQCNVIRMVFGPENVAAMRLRVAQNDAALNENINEMLGLKGSGLKVEPHALMPILSDTFSSPLTGMLGSGSDEAHESPTRTMSPPPNITSPLSSNSMYGNALVPPASSPSFAVSAANMPFATSQGHRSVRGEAPPRLGEPLGGGEPPFAVETARPFTCHTSAIIDLAHIGTSGDLVCSASLDKSICVWDSLSFDLRYTFKLTSILKSPMVIAPHGVVICPLENACIVALSATSGTVLSETSPHLLKDPCISGCLVPGTTLAAFGTYGGRLIVFNPMKGTIEASRTVHAGAVTCVGACAPPNSSDNGLKYLVSCSDDRVTNITSYTTHALADDD